MKKIMTMMTVMAIMMVLFPVAVMASDPYKDVTHSTVDSKSYDAIVYIKAHGGWKGLDSGGKLYPNNYILRREFIQVLFNLYGEKKAPHSIYDVLCANDRISAKYTCGKLVTLSKTLKYPIKWSGSADVKMKRKDAARYIKIFADYNKKLAP